MDVILLERVGKLGHMGDTVRVKDGYARNFLLPRGKALRATEANKKKFEARRADLEVRNHELKRGAGEVSSKSRGRRSSSFAGRRNRAALRLGVGARHRRGADRRRPPGPARPCRRFSTRSRRLACIRSRSISIPRSRPKVTVNVARSAEQAERQAKGEDLTVREQTSMDDLGLEVGKALAEAGPGESLGRE